MIRLYLDTCCFSRPLDNQEQLRVKLETDAVLDILEQCARGTWTLIGSAAVQAELAAISNEDRRLGAQELAAFAAEHVSMNEDLLRRGQMLEQMGFGVYDSLHVACAEAAAAHVLLTTDDALVRRARRMQHEVGTRVANPLTWLKERPV